ncbi:uncharacterized protein LOC133035735 [Cannabis sativa]|uniref:uncharacterized protein LOC133035735 n=1 Tax=Cannabis sativa TaxID=3483 RepID=UPI0029CAA539|nr:uncharacterized protein LOC133035735 [Cannabis sativa]
MIEIPLKSVTHCDRIWKLMNQWHAKLFSIGGREVLLKAVVQSIPPYAMSCFSLPKKFCNQLESMMANFWWVSNTNNSKIHWKKWKVMCSSKADGGMGFRSFIHFNQALLAKQAWRILDIPDSLLARVLKARCYPNFYTLTWHHMMVTRGIDFEQWDIQILEQHFGTIDIERILSIPLSPFPKDDKIIWHHSDTSFYTVKSGYHLAVSSDLMDDHSSSSTNRRWWNRLWKITPSTACALCKCSWESVGHAIFRCERDKSVWNKLHFNVYIPNIGNIKGFDIYSHLAAAHNDTDLELITGLMWCIWSERNKEIHGTKPKPAAILCSFAAPYLSQYHKATAQLGVCRNDPIQ